jgi:hypothetical protein
MTLGELVDRLEELDRDATIYAARPWDARARAAVAVEANGGAPSADAPDLEYFLEVEAALEAAQASTAATRFERVLYYAENDAFLFDG